MSEPSINLDARPPYVRGRSGRSYNVSRGVQDVDRYLGQLHEMGATAAHVDVDILLDARHVLAAREKATETKEATA